MVKNAIKDKDDVLGVIGEALSALGRDDDVVFSYGVVNDEASGKQLIYFDLPRVSPLQFNLSLERSLSRNQITHRIKEAIQTRLEAANSKQTFGL